jgi:hypothetical protein
MNDTDDGDDIRRPATANTGMERQSLTRQNSMAPTLDFKYVPLPCELP